MDGPTLIVLTYLLLGIFAVTFTVRTLRIMRLPVHLRWELAPVPHEKGKGHYGGSYLEEPEWWTKPREKSLVAEGLYMFKEIVFLKALWEHNRSLWWVSFPFHFGLYVLTAMLGLVLLGGVANLAGIGGPGIGIVSLGVPLLAGIGYLLGGVGALGLLASRLASRRMRSIATPVTFLNLAILLAFFASGVWAVATVTGFGDGTLAVLGALLTADPSVDVPGALAAHVLLGGVFLAWLPFTQMMHFVAKYFTYHQVRWDDEPLVAGSEMEKEIQALLGQTVSWAGPHIGADGTKNWVDIATAAPSEENGR
jgi:nitrate reductase gamma subunit